MWDPEGRKINLQGRNQSGALKDKTVMEWSKTQLLRLEESLEAMEKQIGSTHPHVSFLLLMHFCLHPVFTAVLPFSNWIPFKKFEGAVAVQMPCLLTRQRCGTTQTLRPGLH